MVGERCLISTGVDILSKQQQEKIVQYLNEAHATELALVRELQAQIAMTPKGGYRGGLEQHLRETRQHSRRIEERLGELGQGSNPLQLGVGVVQTVAGQALAFAKAPLNVVRGSGGEEKVLKNAKDACASEALEIATYMSLARLARVAGDQRTERLAESLLADELRMLDRVLGEIPRLTDAVTRAEIEANGSYDVTEGGAADAARAVGATAKRTARKGTGKARRTSRQARKVPGVARAEGAVKGAVGSESDLAISGYNSRSASDILEKLPELSQMDLAKVDGYERKNENRSTITSRIDSLQGEEPWPGYDELRVDEVRAALSEGDEQRIKNARAYERKHKARAGVIQAAERELSKDVTSVQAKTATPRPDLQNESSGAESRDGSTRRLTQPLGAATMNPTESAVAAWRGAAVVDQDGEKIGTVEAIYIDTETGKPEWVAVKTGMVGSKLSFMPIAEASETGGQVRVPYDNQQVKDAPAVEPDGELSQEEEANLYRHYGLDYSEARSDTGLPRGNGRDTVGHDTSGPTTDDAMTRSEEELRVGKTSRESGRRAAAQVRRHRAGAADGARAARGGPRRARADHRRQRRRRHGRPGDLRSRARGHPSRGRGRRREARRAQGARAPRQGHRDRGPNGLRAGPQGADRGRGRHPRPRLEAARWVGRGRWRAPPLRPLEGNAMETSLELPPGRGDSDNAEQTDQRRRDACPGD